MQSNIFEELTVVKRSGQRVSFNPTKIALAVKSAFDSLDSNYSIEDINKVFDDVLNHINKEYSDRKTINVEDIQDIIEEKLKSNNYNLVYDAFNSYRLRRAASREVFSMKQQHKFVKAIETLGLQTNTDNYDEPLKVMNGFGKAVSKEFAKAYLIDNKYIRSHDEGLIRIHDLFSYPLYTTSKTHLDLRFLKKETLDDYINELINIIINCKNEQTDEHSINEIDSLFEKILLNNFKIIYKRNVFNYLRLIGLYEYVNIKQISNQIDNLNSISIDINIFNDYLYNSKIKDLFINASIDSKLELNEILYKSIKSLLIRLNNINSIINNNLISISLGNNDKEENKIVKNIFFKVLNELDCLENVCIIYKINKIDDIPIEVTNLINDKKNISFSFNSNCEYFINGEKIYSNINDDILISTGRSILSTTTINLSRLGIMNKDKDLDSFYKDLTYILDFTKNQLIQRFDVQANKNKKVFPSLFKYNLLFDSDKLEDNQKIRKVLKNGVLNISLSGLYECIEFLKEKNKEKLLINTLKYINERLNAFTNDVRLNFILSLETNQNINKELITIDKSIYGANIFKTDSYKLLNNINYEEIEKAINIQEYINTRINIYINKNINNKDLKEVMKVVKKQGIMYFKIIRGKYEN